MVINETVAENFQNLMKNMNTHIQKSQQNSKKDKLKEIHVKIFYIQSVKTQI